MPRNMSFMLTTQQVRNGTKDVTRRLGWKNIKDGEILNACVQCQGIPKGQKIEKIRQIRVIRHGWEPLNAITKEEVAREGFPWWGEADFIVMFCDHNKCTASTPVNRIEFEYL